MRLLVVEDEPQIAHYLQRGLEAEGFAVDLAEEGETGLWLATEVPYDLIILDIMLPKLDGLAICRRLREAGRWMPILMLTARDGEADEAEGLDLGADDYLHKPFSFLVLLARIRALLRRGAPERPALLVAGDLSLDPAERKLLRGETEIPLTAREFALMEYFMRHPGQVLGKTQIIEHVWDWSYEGGPNIVEVYVGYLRKKVDAPFGRQAIETLRGAGYRLAADGG
jgi:DNA-binding response OmpR family regulator